VDENNNVAILGIPTTSNDENVAVTVFFLVLAYILALGIYITDGNKLKK